MRPIEHGIAVVALRTPTLPPATTTNCYLLGERRITVVDPGSPWAEEQDRIELALAARVAAGATVERILLTHHHPDHLGAAARLARSLGAPVAAHRLTRDLVADRVEVGLPLADGDEIDTGAGRWLVLHTPGHAPGHLCLLGEDRRFLVAGDMVAGEGTIVLDPPEGELAAYLASLDRLRSLDPAVLLPAHGPPLEPGREVLDRYLAHRMERTGQLLRAMAARPAATAADLVGPVYGAIEPWLVPVAERQVLAHLLGLEARGRARQDASGRWTLGDGDG